VIRLLGGKTMHAVRWHQEVDAVVAGSGGAGLAAAIELADAKADVMVFEKQGSIAETSTYQCGGVFSFAGTDFQERRGVRDSEDLLYKDLMEVGQWKNEEELVQVYVKNQRDTYYWLTGLGVKWLTLEVLAGMSVPRGHVTDPAQALEVLKEAAERRGARIVFDTRVTELLTDEEERVAGVRVEGKGGTMRVKARHGVILATGGIGRNIERLRAIDPRYTQVIPLMGAGHTGDGHQMAEALGAYLRDMEYIKPTFGIHEHSTTNAELVFMYYHGAIIVNKEGKRFVNESISYKDVGMAALEQTDGVGIQIFDQKLYEVGLEKAKGVRPEHAVWGLDARRRRLLVTAATLEELAAKIAVPPGTLQETVARYNSQVDSEGDTDFGRKTLVGGTGKPVKIETPPFYAFVSKGAFPGTYGGICLDEAMHVLKRDGIIPGLYAAGEIVGGFHGASYMTGTAVGKAVIFGRVAGRNVASGR
jgi:fumarate reductase flavoprotein subunit